MPTSQTYSWKDGRFCYYFHKLVHALPQWNNYWFISHFLPTLLHCHSMCEISIMINKAWCCTCSLFIYFLWSAFTFSGVPPMHPPPYFNTVSQTEWQKLWIGKKDWVFIFLPHVPDIPDYFARCALKKFNKYEHNCSQKNPQYFLLTGIFSFWGCLFFFF